MYLPKHFEEARVEVLHQLIHAHPLGALVTLAPGGLDANHIPFEVDPEPTPFGTLRGHVARANPMWREFSRETDALVIFQGPGTYISPAWYATKDETGRVVPTWNYVVVHAHGPLRIFEDPSLLEQHVRTLTNLQEARLPHPWSVDDAPVDFFHGQLSGIVGIEIPLTRLEGK